jgi:D-3-phosphoglycerate dehydrogenase / 2-oxoglutarate reductase
MPTSALSFNIKNQQNGEQDSGAAPLTRSVSRSQASYSTSPVEHFRRPSRGSFGGEGASPLMRRMTTQSGAVPKQLKPFREEDIKILLLENVNITGIEILKGQGYQVETLKSSLSEDQLIEKIKYAPSTTPQHINTMC